MKNQPVSKKLSEYKRIRTDYRESTVEILDRAAGWFIELFGDLAVNTISYSHIEDYKRWLLNGRSAASANTYLAVLKSFFSWLVRRRFIEVNPYEGILLYKVSQKKFDVYSLDELKRLFSVSNELWSLIISLALCGMRESEILNLCIGDIDFENNRLRITAKKDTIDTWRWDIKDCNEAYVGFDSSVAELLLRRKLLIQDMPYVCLKEKYWQRNIRLRDQGLLRGRMRNNPWGNFNRDFRALQKRAMIVKPKRFHDFRLTFTTERYNSGYGIKELQYLLRHSAISTTARYINNIDEQHLVARSGEFFAQHYATFNVL